jgi:hypothetical protein
MTHDALSPAHDTWPAFRLDDPDDDFDEDDLDDDPDEDDEESDEDEEPWGDEADDGPEWQVHGWA